MLRQCAIVMLLALALSAAALTAADLQQLSAEPRSTTPQVNSALAFQRQMQFYKAKLEQNPQDPVMHNLLGICYQGLRRTDDAIKEYKKATAINPRYAEAWNNMGSAYHLKRKLKQAAKHYRKAIELKPELGSAHRNLGTALLSLGKLDEGLAAYRRAYELNPDAFNPTASSIPVEQTDGGMQYFCFAKISAAGGHIDTALDFLHKAKTLGFRDFRKVEKDPDFAKVITVERYESVKEGLYQP
jgi:tetratricopeptide (TPR) repeat protein